LFFDIFLEIKIQETKVTKIFLTPTTPAPGQLAGTAARATPHTLMSAVGFPGVRPE